MGWTDRFTWSKKDETSPSESLSRYVQVTPEARRQMQDLQETALSHPFLLMGVGCTLSFGLGVQFGRRYLQTPFWRRFTSVNDMPSSYFDQSQWLRGRVVSVSDGDTVRFLHVPTIFHARALRDGEKLSETALPIRICTLDTPETSKFGKPGQPFGEEAKEYLGKLVQDHTVRVRLLTKDQYGRAVAEVKVGLLLSKYADEQMIKAGLAEVYQGSGAVYGRLGKEKYLQLEQQARDSKKGIWSLKNRESAAEYKARTQ